MATVPKTLLPPDRRTAARAVAEAVRRELPALLDRVVDRIRAEIAFYAAGSVVTTEMLRESVTHNVGWMLDGLTGEESADLRAPEATGRARAAQGAPLVDVLSAYRVGFTELWAAVVTARELRVVSDRDLADLAGHVFALQNAYCDALIGAYRDEAHQLVRAREREQAVLVDELFSGAATSGSLWQVADALRLPLDGTFLVVVAAAELGHDPLPRAESALAVLDVRSVWRLQADLSLGLLTLPDRTRNAAVLQLLERHATGPIGVSPVFGELRVASWGLRLARLALGSHAGGTGVEQFQDSPLGVLVAAAPHAALDAARAVLGRALDLPEDDRDLLLGTFEAWIEARGSAKDAAVALFCHPNTVRYRLRRLETITGRTVEDPSDLAELVTATRAWVQLPHPT